MSVDLCCIYEHIGAIFVQLAGHFYGHNRTKLDKVSDKVHI